MATQLHDTGEEAIIKDFFAGSISKPSSLDIGLYSDSTDALTDSSDVGSITTEPAGSAYARQAVGIDGSTTLNVTTQQSGGDWEVVFDDVTYDTSNSSQSVDAYFVVINYQSETTGDTSASNHLLFTGGLDQAYNLGDIDTFTLSGSGLSLS